MMDRDWFPSAALLLLQAQLRLGGPVPEVEVAKLWTVPRVHVAKCVSYLRTLGFTVTRVVECRLTTSGQVRRTGECSYYIGRLEDATDVPAGRPAPCAEAEEAGERSLPALWRSPVQGHERQGRRRGSP